MNDRLRLCFYLTNFALQYSQDASEMMTLEHVTSQGWQTLKQFDNRKKSFLASFLSSERVLSVRLVSVVGGCMTLWSGACDPLTLLWLSSSSPATYLPWLLPSPKHCRPPAGWMNPLLYPTTTTTTTTQPRPTKSMQNFIKIQYFLWNLQHWLKIKQAPPWDSNVERPSSKSTIPVLLSSPLYWINGKDKIILSKLPSILRDSSQECWRT